MSIIVQKFGGTSVATADKIRAAAARAVAAKRAGHQVVMVVSARGHKTDELVRLAEEMSDRPASREMDMLLSTGEQESVALVAMGIHGLGEKAVSLTGGQIGIITDSTFSKARIQSISTERIKAHLDAGEIVVACGFQGIDGASNITTLGRGGSDTTATALAAALQAEECQIYTDVEGVFTTDPRAVLNARKIDEISYDEMLELASLGAGVMHSRSIEFAKKFRVPLRVRPSFSDSLGTLISNRTEDRVVTGLALAKNEARVTLADLPDQPGVMATIFSQMSAHKIPIDMVVQNVAVSGKAEVTFTVPEGDLAETLTAAELAVKALGAGFVRSGTHVSKISAVGNGMLTHSGVAAQMFKSLSDEGINLEMITTSEIKISALVDRSRSQDALLAVHKGFSLEEGTAVVPSIGSAGVAATRATMKESSDILEAVVSKLASMEDIVVSEVLLDDSQSLVTLNNAPDLPGICTKLFTAVSNANVMVDMIVQNVSHSGQAQISFTVPRSQLAQCTAVLDQLLIEWPQASINTEPNIAKLSVAGIGLRTHTAVGDRLFRSLADAGVNIQMINTSEIRTSVVVDLNQGPKAYDALKIAFKLV
ncbi:aspartate kinase [Planctomicrobium sp. SH527]|uniref:aspartate kinase n=1 Tax=Planctomicrobium sp. SH527 TaxID=3448123 RepID=UPI003F5BAB9C